MNAIVMMAKEPKAGEVKTRLIPPLTADSASELYINFLLDKIRQVNSIENADAYLAYFPGTAKDQFLKLIPDEFHLIEQEGTDLGERLADVSSKVLDSGHSKVIMIDSDTPNLPTSYLEDGLSALDEHDVAIGPCEDGGYYLIGIKSKIPELFTDIPWSTPEVTNVTQKKSDSLGLQTVKLNTWYDVDTYDDLQRLKMDLESSRNVGETKYFCENTYKFLHEIMK